MHAHHSRHRQTPVDVREQVCATLEILVEHVAGQAAAVDLEQRQVRSPNEPPIRHVLNLMRVRAVNEAVRGKRLRHVESIPDGGVGFLGGRNVED